MKASLLIVVLFSTRALVGCVDEQPNECRGGEAGPVPTCATVCTHLFEMTCRVGSSAAECEAICAGSGAPTDFPEALRCYQAATSCDGVNACSRGCGPDASTVPFAPVTLGSDAADEQDGGQ